MYLFITRFSTPYTAILLLSFILLAGCGQSDDQREFEREAFAPPNNYTETTDDRQVLSEDPDDWRVSPFYQGLVEVDPAYPNPIETTGQVNIDVDVTGIESVPGLRLIVYFHENNGSNLIYESNQNPLPPGLTPINFSAQELGRFDTTESQRDLHRVILIDNNENVISYGDIMVE